MTRDTRDDATRDRDDVLWAIVVPGRYPHEVAEALRHWGVLGALDGADVLLRDMDPDNIALTIGMDPLAPDEPVAHYVLRWSLTQTLRYRAGMPLNAEGTVR